MENTAKRRRSVVVAGHLGNTAHARAHLHDGEPAVRVAAMTALVRCAAVKITDLRLAAGDPAVTVRRGAATAISRLAQFPSGTTAGSPTDPDTAQPETVDPETVEPETVEPGTAEPETAEPETARLETADLETVALELLGDDDPTVAEIAAFALGELPDGSPRRVEELAQVATGHQDSLCREAAVAALGSVGDPAGLAAVLTACGDRATVRRRAVLALAAFDGDEVTLMLESLTGDRDLQVSQAAEDLLGIETGENI